MNHTHAALLIGLGLYCLITMLIYWSMVLKGFTASGVKTLDWIARLAILVAPLLIPYAIIRGVFSLIFSKKKEQ